MSAARADARTPPGDEALAAMLGGAWTMWEAARESIRAAFPDLKHEWKLYGASGWWMKALRGKRNLLFLVPMEGACDAVFIFGEKAVAAARNAEVPEFILKKIDEARPFAEGRGFRFPLATKKDIDILIRLAEIKARN